MPSEYQKWIARDVKPEEKIPLTKAQQRKNWWYYHKWYVLFGAVLLFGLGSILWHVLGIGQVEPDYRIAYVGTKDLPEGAVSAVENALAELGEDLNGDGKTVVELTQYVSQDLESNAAANVALVGDLVSCESYFFLLEDPEGFQKRTQALCRLDGSLASEEDPVEELCLSWDLCPVLAGMELGDYEYSLLGGTKSGSIQELLSGLYIARRGFWGNEAPRHPEGCAALWEAITEGALPAA